ncbi:type VI secretion system-associated lipoprotein TagQ [Pseudomonas fluorescens]|uniref:Glycine zipper 2TM domain-containing protein n=1 Tax=Pseudomonas fluorescens TaxID=294 RepID=A0A944HLZ0_PSEFL|nr:type VI secretion system-associated lipoprotein TagQ [Pseudomonas fluorescens]MBT2298648.1 glycine zipper 2TM domain-containing protein [Pseudomonas fluorescens]MBT2308079.1 glycine zipper 2TM domain-containing protein [Pseudomonas fluorescens]MBT2312843.1 glycine zipper 2TM domain-containing protein [Pseudomonas fluorescens]MBT2317606.1 glycine zipper 2TM domain-containing protein [Pseudomonas fluorescens]MBT2332263.1 glycine zipper 2TM domain-containing protein [Pseudomonas fluorescens]
MLFSRKPFASVSKRHLLMVAVGFSTVLTGCATSPTSKVASSTKVEYYPNCYEPVQHLRATEGNMTKSVITGAAVGAVGGALLGALTADKEDRGRNAAIGAAGGALAGGATGYYTERQKQIADDNQRIASYAADVNKSVSDIDRSTAYAKTSQQCYQNAFSKLVADRKAKTVNDTEGRKRLAEIVSGLKESNDLIVAVNGKAAEDLNNYTQAYEKDLQQVGVQRTDVVTVATAETKPVVASTKTKKAVKPAKKPVLPAVPKEAVTTEKTLQTAKAKQDESKQVASAGTTQVNSMCKNPDLGDWAPVPCPNV